MLFNVILTLPLTLSLTLTHSIQNVLIPVTILRLIAAAPTSSINYGLVDCELFLKCNKYLKIEKTTTTTTSTDFIQN